MLPPPLGHQNLIVVFDSSKIVEGSSKLLQAPFVASCHSFLVASVNKSSVCPIKQSRVIRQEQLLSCYVYCC